MYSLIISIISASTLVAVFMWVLRQIARKVDVIKREIFHLSRKVFDLATNGPLLASMPPPTPFPVLLELSWQDGEPSYIVALYNPAVEEWISCETGTLLNDYHPTRWWLLPAKSDTRKDGES